MEEKRYEVFISSTFLDLKDERESVMRAVLKLDCFPAGMELFPAAGAMPWDVIKRAIDRCDYYVVLVAGRYGLSDEVNLLSYTEREFDYAVQQHIPVLAFVHGEPDSIPVGKTDKSDEAQKRLEAFRKKVSTGRTRVEWRNPDDLATKVTQALVSAFKTDPRPGWIRGPLPGSEAEQLTRDGTEAAPTASMSMLRGYLQTKDYRFHELLSEAVSVARDAAASIRAEPNVPDDEYRALVIACEAASADLIYVASTTGYFGDDQQQGELVTAIEQLLAVNELRRGYVHLNQLRTYPAVLTFYAAGVAAVAKSNYALLRTLHALPVEEPTLGRRVHPLHILSPDYALKGPLQATATDSRSIRSPESDRVFEALQPSLLKLPMMSDKRYADVFTRFEYLNALAAHMSKDAYPFYGSFLWRGVNRVGRGGAAEATESELNQQGREWPPFAAGIFGPDLDALKAAKAALDKSIQHIRMTS